MGTKMTVTVEGKEIATWQRDNLGRLVDQPIAYLYFDHNNHLKLSQVHPPGPRSFPVFANKDDVDKALQDRPSS